MNKMIFAVTLILVSVSALAAAHDEGEPGGGTKHPIKETSLGKGTLNAIVKVTERSESYIESRYESGKPVPVKKFDNKNLAEALNTASESKGDADKDIDKERPIAKFLVEMISVHGEKGFKKMVDWVWKRDKELSEKDERDGLNSSDRQEKLMLDRLKWLTMIDCNAEKEGCKESKSPEAQAFNAAVKDAIKEREKLNAEIEQKKKDAANGNNEAKKDLRGYPDKDANDPANRWAILGHDTLAHWQNALKNGDKESVARDVEALSWKGNANDHLLYATNAKGETVQIGFDKDLRGTNTLDALKEVKDWSFVANQPKGTFPGFRGEADGSLKKQAPPPEAKGGGQQKDGAGYPQAGQGGNRNQGASIYNNKCLSCHGPGKTRSSDPLVMTSDSIQRVSSGNMPKGSRLSAQEKNDLLAYLGNP